MAGVCAVLLGRGLWRRDDGAWNGAMITLGYMSGLLFFGGACWVVRRVSSSSCRR